MSPYPPFISDFFFGLPVALSSELYNFKLSVVQDIKTPADILLQITQTLPQVHSVLLSCKRVLLTNISLIIIVLQAIFIMSFTFTWLLF